MNVRFYLAHETKKANINIFTLLSISLYRALYYTFQV